MDATMTSSSPSYSSPSDAEGLDISSSDYDEGAAVVPATAASTVRRGRTLPKHDVHDSETAGAPTARRVASPHGKAESASTTLRRVSGDYTTRMAEAHNRSEAMERYKLMVQAARLVPTPKKPDTEAAQDEEGAGEPAYPVSTEVSEDSSDDEDDSIASVEVSAIQERREKPAATASGAAAVAAALPTNPESSHTAERSRSGRASNEDGSRPSDRRAAQAALAALHTRASPPVIAPAKATPAEPQSTPPHSTKRSDSANTNTNSSTQPAAMMMIRKRRPSDVDKELAEVAALAEAAATSPVASSKRTDSAKPTTSTAAAAVAAVAAKRAATARAIAEVEAEETRALREAEAKDAARKAHAAAKAATKPNDEEAEAEEKAHQAATEAEEPLVLPDGPVLPRSNLTDTTCGFEPDYNPVYSHARTPRGDRSGAPAAAAGRPSHKPRPSSSAEESSSDAPQPPPQHDGAPAPPRASASNTRTDGSHSARHQDPAKEPTSHEGIAEKKRPAGALSTGSGSAFWVRPASALYETTASIAAKRADAPRPSSSSMTFSTEKGCVSARGRPSSSSAVAHRASSRLSHHMDEETTHGDAPADPVSGRRRSGRLSARRDEAEKDAPAATTTTATGTAAATDTAEMPEMDVFRRSTQHRHGPRRTSTSSSSVPTQASRRASDDSQDAPVPSQPATATTSAKPSKSPKKTKTAAAAAASTTNSSTASAKLHRMRSSTGSAQPCSARHSGTGAAGVTKTRPSSSSSGTTSQSNSVFTRLSSTNHSGLHSAAVVVPVSARTSASRSNASTRQQESFQRHCSRLTSLRTANEEAEKKAAAKDEQQRTSKGSRKVTVRRSASGRPSATATAAAAVGESSSPALESHTPAPVQPVQCDQRALRRSGTVSKQLIYDEEAEHHHDHAHDDDFDDDDDEPCPLSKAPRATARRDSASSLLEDTPCKSRRRETDKAASPVRPDDEDETQSDRTKAVSGAAGAAAAATATTTPTVSQTQQRIAEIRAQYGAHLGQAGRPSASAPAVRASVGQASPAGLPPMPRPSATITDPIARALQSAAYQRRCLLPCYLCGDMQSLSAYAVHLGLCHKKTAALLQARGLDTREDVQTSLATMSSRLVPNSADDANEAEREAFTLAAFQCAKQLLVPCSKCGTQIRMHDAKEHELLCGRAHYERSKAAERVREAVHSIESGASHSSIE